MYKRQVLSDPSEILEALVGLKDVRVLHYERAGPDVALVIEQVLDEVSCPSCGKRAQVKERPVVSYIDLPVYGFPMRLSWKKHRMKCVNANCPKRTWVLRDLSLIHISYFRIISSSKPTVPTQ